MQSKHLQNDFTVNVFSIAEMYMPPVLRCQAVSSAFVLAGSGKRVLGLPAGLLQVFDQPRLAICRLPSRTVTSGVIGGV
jgi:hypothetical protein